MEVREFRWLAGVARLQDGVERLAREYDVDALCDGETVVIGAIMQHIEQAGVHSGDSACSLPPFSLSPALQEELRRLAGALAGVGARPNDSTRVAPSAAHDTSRAVGRKVSQRCSSRRDSRRALARFCAILGSVAGDVALVHGARTVMIAGGIIPRFVPFLRSSAFRERFLAKGRFAAYLESVSIQVVTHPNPGLLGAAVALRKRAAPSAPVPQGDFLRGVGAASAAIASRRDRTIPDRG